MTVRREDRHIRVRPFSAWRFNAGVVSDPALCASPPYDQLNDPLIARLEGQSPFNVARLIKAPVDGGPDATGAHYQRAAALLREWATVGAIAPDSGPGIYPYSQSYLVGSYEVTRNGFIALGDLRDTRWFPHEETHPHVRDDRCRLRLATAADFGLIFMIFSDPGMSVDRVLRDCDFGSPILTVEQADGSTHRLYRCGSPSFAARIAGQMADLDCVIADGHHRMAAAFDAWRLRNTDDWAYAMMAFFNADAPGTTIRPIHRAVARGANWRFGEFLEALADRFSVQDIPSDGLSSAEVASRLESVVRERQRTDRIAFGMVGPDPSVIHVVESPLPPPDDWPWPERSDDNYRRLATTVFEIGVLRNALGVPAADIAEGRGLSFPKDSTDVVDQVRSGASQVGFILPPTSLAAVFHVARQRRNLPQKSTFFFPKLLSGLVIHRIAETAPD